MTERTIGRGGLGQPGLRGVDVAFQGRGAEVVQEPGCGARRELAVGAARRRLPDGRSCAQDRGREQVSGPVVQGRRRRHARVAVGRGLD
jgi:hypothetical protein